MTFYNVGKEVKIQVLEECDNFNINTDLQLAIGC